MVPVLETERLLLRPITLEDAPQIQQLFPHWELVKFLNAKVPWPYPADGTLTHIRDASLPAMARGECWCWTIRLKERPEQIIGCLDLVKSETTNRGFWLGIPWQGKGYMREAADAATEFWFETLEMPLLRVPKAIDNTASRKISVSQGMRVVREEMRDYVSGKHPSETWEITRDEWRKRKPNR